MSSHATDIGLCENLLLLLLLLLLLRILFSQSGDVSFLIAVIPVSEGRKAGNWLFDRHRNLQDFAFGGVWVCGQQQRGRSVPSPFLPNRY